MANKSLVYNYSQWVAKKKVEQFFYCIRHFGWLLFQQIFTGINAIRGLFFIKKKRGLERKTKKYLKMRVVYVIVDAKCT